MPKAPKLGRFFRNAVKLGATSNDISNDLIADTTTIAQEDRMAKIAVLLVWLDESNAHHLSTTRTGRRTHCIAVLLCCTGGSTTGLSATDA
jgi:hypothetical protein